MKRLISLAIGIILVVLCVAANATDSLYVSPGQGVTAKSSVNVREDTSTSSKRVVQLKEAGTVVTVLGESVDTEGVLWYRISTSEGNEGYIRGDLLTISEPGVMAAPDLAAESSVTEASAAEETESAVIGSSDSAEAPYDEERSNPETQVINVPDESSAYISDGSYQTYGFPVDIYCNQVIYQPGEPVTVCADILGGTGPFSIEWYIDGYSERWDSFDEPENPLNAYMEAHPEILNSTKYTTSERHIEFTFTPPAEGGMLSFALYVTDANGENSDDMSPNDTSDVVTLYSAEEWYLKFPDVVFPGTGASEPNGFPFMAETVSDQTEVRYWYDDYFDDNIFTTLSPRGAQVEVAGQAYDDNGQKWYAVRLDFLQTGYVRSDMLKASGSGSVLTEPLFVSEGEYSIRWVPVDVYSDTYAYHVGEPVTFTADILGGTAPFKVSWCIGESIVRDWSPMDEYMETHPDYPISASYTTDSRHLEFVYTPPVESEEFGIYLSVTDANGIDEYRWTEGGDKPPKLWISPASAVNTSILTEIEKLTKQPPISAETSQDNVVLRDPWGKETIIPHQGTPVRIIGVERDYSSDDIIYIVRYDFDSFGMVSTELIHIPEILYASRYEEHTTELYSQPTEENLSAFDELLTELSDQTAPFVNSEGHVVEGKESEIMKVATDFVYEEYTAGKLSEYEIGEDYVYIRDAVTGITYTYLIPTEGTDAGNGELTVYTYQPVYQEYINEVGQIIAPYMEMPDDAANTLDTNFDECTFSDWSNLDNDEVQYNVFNQFGQNQFIIWHGHGGFTKKHGPYILTATKSSADFKFAHWDDYVNNRLTNCGFFGLSLFGINVCVTSKYIDQYCSDLSGTVVYMGICHSGQTNQLANAFLNKGAIAYIGNSATIKTVYNTSVQNAMIHYLTLINPETEDYYTLHEALQAAYEMVGYGDVDGVHPIIFGNGNYRIKSVNPESESTRPSTTVSANCFVLGQWEQDGNPDNGPEPLYWRALRSEGGGTYAICENLIEIRPFGGGLQNWERSSLRSWLNGEFYENAFSDADKSRIVQREQLNIGNDFWVASDDSPTSDIIFLPSYTEITTMMPADAERIAMPTVYAAKQANLNDDEVYYSWWLRSNGVFIGQAMEVLPDGSINQDGTYGGDEKGIRPAIWVNAP